jgi:branched-chain amino acid transport system permease protein
MQRAPVTYRRLQWFGICALIALLVYLPLISDARELRNHTKIIITVLAVLGVNIATGYGGMISLGHAVFVGVGAFGTAYFVDDMGLPWVISLVGGAVSAAIFGLLIAVPALRIRGIHLALVTLAFAIVFQPLAKRFPKFSGGISGKSVEAELVAPGIFGEGRLADARWQYVFCIAVCVVAILLVRNVIDSRAGRAMRALRDNQTSAAVYGVNLVRTRIATFALSAGLAGLAGGLQVVLVPFVSQENYPPQASLVLYATAVIGGLGSLWGSVFGVAIRQVFGEVGDVLKRIDDIPVLSELFDLLDSDSFVFGVGLIALMFLVPGGLASIRLGRGDRVGRLAAWVRRRYRAA